MNQKKIFEWQTFRWLDSQNRDFGGRTRHSFAGKGSNDDGLGGAKQFGIGE